jgi:hypothetical protein
MFPDFRGPLVLPLMLIMGIIGGMAYASIPAFLKARLNTNEILSSLMLVYVAQLFLDWTVRGPVAQSRGLQLSGKPQFPCRRCPAGNPLGVRPCALRFRLRADRRVVHVVHAQPHAEGF